MTAGKNESAKIIIYVYAIIIFAIMVWFCLPNFIPIYDHKFISAPLDLADYQYYFYGGLMLRNDNPHVYDNAEFCRFYAPFRHIREKHHMLNYPPLIYVIFSALAFKDIRDINLLWYVINYVILFLTLILLFLCMGEDEDRLPLKITIFILTGIFYVLFSPSMSTVMQNQVNFLMSFLMILSLFFYLRNREIPSAVFLGLAISLKLIPVILLGFFLLRKRYRIIIYCLATIIAVHLLITLIWGPALLSGYFENVVFSYKALANVDDWRNQSLIAFLTRLFATASYSHPIITAPFLVKPLRYVLSSLIIATVGLITLRSRRNPQIEIPRKDWTSESILFCLYIVSILVLNILVWTHHSVILLLPLPFLIQWLIHRKNVTPVLLLSCLLIITCYGMMGAFNAWEIYGKDPFRGEMRWGFMMSHWPSILLLVFWGAYSTITAHIEKDRES